MENSCLTVAETTLAAHTLHMSETSSLSASFMLLRTALLRVQAVASACQHFVPHNLNIAPEVIMMTMNKSILLPFLLNLEDCLVPSLLIYTTSLDSVHLHVYRLCQWNTIPRRLTSIAGSTRFNKSSKSYFRARDNFLLISVDTKRWSQAL